MYSAKEIRPKVRYSGNTKREQLMYRVEVLDAKGGVWCTIERPLARTANADAQKLVRILNGTLF